VHAEGAILQGTLSHTTTALDTFFCII